MIRFVALITIFALTIIPANADKDIRELSQHFITPGDDVSPWVFYPQENIKDLSTDEHPGFATIWHREEGKDIKGVPEDPIRIDDYPLPWEFHLGLSRGTQAPQSNWALGLNLVLTFSDPSTWPEDRMQLPPDTHSFQLLTTHLKGPQIESGPLNYFAPSSDPLDGKQDGHGGDPYVKASSGPRKSEAWMLYGRGDLDSSVMGNWKVPYNWLGYPDAVWGDLAGGPMSHSLHFRVKIVSPTMIDVGFSAGLQGEPHPGWRMRTIDVSRFGKITGIWEIGPIISLDNWIAEDLPKELGISASPPLKVSDPSRLFYMVDYAVFFGASVKNFEHLSDDFDVPGFHAKWYHEAGAITDAYTNPGYLTVTLLPQADAIWAMCPTAIGQDQIDLSEIEDFPGYEYEICWIPPDDETFPWKSFMTSFSMWTESGKSIGYGNPAGGGWTPGVEYLPKEKKHRFNSTYNLVGKDFNELKIEFEPELPESILAHKPLYMLMQIPDASHLRVGFKANKEDPWHLSKPFDVTKVFGEKLGKFDPYICFWSGVSKGGAAARGIGNYPRYPRFLFDYVTYRWGLTTPTEQAEDWDPDYYYRFTNGWQTGKSLDVVNDGDRNDQVQLANTGNFTGQRWQITDAGDGYYRFTNGWQKDKSIDVINDGDKNNQLHLVDTGNFSGQMWKITDVGDGYFCFTNGWQTDKSLDIINDGDRNTQVHLANTGNFSGQMWKVEKTDVKVE